jgi:hypothetical protein
LNEKKISAKGKKELNGKINFVFLLFFMNENQLLKMNHLNENENS